MAKNTPSVYAADAQQSAKDVVQELRLRCGEPDTCKHCPYCKARRLIEHFRERDRQRADHNDKPPKSVEF